jgi:hypothetical protein
MTAFVDPMYLHASIAVPPHFSRANIAPKSKYTYPSSAQSIDTLTYPPEQIMITYPEITHPQVHHVSANIDLDIERYIPIRYNPKFPPHHYPSKPYCIGELIPIRGDNCPLHRFIKLLECTPTGYWIILWIESDGSMAEYEYHAVKDLIQVSGPPGKVTRLKELLWIIWRFGKELFQSCCCRR